MTDNKFAVEEATIDDVHAAFATGVLTATGLVSTYLARIQDIDKSGPTLNSIISINPNALRAAETLDQHYAKTGSLLGPLHGVPIVVKDQVETKDVMTTFGSIAQSGYMPNDDATRKLKAAGAGNSRQDGDARLRHFVFRLLLHDWRDKEPIPVG